MKIVNIDLEGISSRKFYKLIFLSVEIDVAIESPRCEDEVRWRLFRDYIDGDEFLDVVEECLAEFVELVEEGIT